MKDVITRLANAGLSIYSDEDLHDHLRRELVHAMKDGRFSDALPDPFIHEIATFMKQAIADNKQRVAISLLLGERGLASFLYDIDLSSTGVSHGSAVDWHVPRKGSDRTIPTSFEGYPRLAIDVSVP